MKISKKQLQYKEIATQIFCNKCGNEIKKDENGYYNDFLEIEKSWGYFSGKDGETHRFDICEDCYSGFLNTFKIPFEKNSD